MKKCKKVPAMLLVFALAVAVLSGCEFHAPFGIGGFIAGESYPNAEAYQIGAFTYRADKVNTVEVYWRCGEIEIIESEKAKLNVCESGGEMSEDTAMHYLLEGGTLRIRFCESGAKEDRIRCLFLSV